MSNNIGEIIEVRPILQKHNEEIGCATCSKVCEYLGCQLGEVYAVFDDINDIHKGVMCKIKSDIYANHKLSAFNKNDSISDPGSTSGCDLSAIVYLANYKYIMRLH